MNMPASRSNAGLPMDILVGGKNGSKRMSMDHVGKNSGNTSAETFPLVDDEAGPSRPIDDDDISSLGEGTLGMKRTELPMRRSRQTTSTSASAGAAAASSLHKSSSGSGRNNKDLIAAELSTGKQPKTTAKLAQSLAEMHKKLTDAEERNAKLTKVFKETRTMAESAIAEVKRLKKANADLTAQVEEKTQRLVLQECKFEELQERLDEATTATAGSTTSPKRSAGASGATSTAAANASSRSLLSAPGPGGGVETELRMRIAQLETENRLLRESKNDLMDLLHQREAETDYEISLPPMDEHSAAGGGGGADSSHHSLQSRRGGRRANFSGSSRSMDDYRVSADEIDEDRARPSTSTRSMDDGLVAGLRSRLTKRSSAPMIAQSVASDDDLDGAGGGGGSHDGGTSTTSATKRSSMPFMAHFATAARFEDEISVSQSVSRQ